ncbi:hypothetical protein [Pantoea ananatis]|uniref:hypothetical protein n=1 Tax=Pantoea ananas TaxID=553 RepID=UPI003015950F
MAFVSQVSKSRSTASRIGDSSIVVTQSFKASTNAQELSIRLTASLLSKAGMKNGDLVDVLHDPDEDVWMIALMDGGLKITGKNDAPTGLIRYTLKDGHARFTEDKEHLPIKKSSVEDSIDASSGKIIFKLN